MSSNLFRALMTLLCTAAGMLPALAFAQSTSSVELEGTSWQLVTIHSVANSVFTPESPTDYLLRFRGGGRLQIEADCNQAGATWELVDRSLQLTDLVSTRKLCPAPSLFNRYLMNLQRTASVSRDGERLILQTTSAADRMIFEPYVFTPGG